MPEGISKTARNPSYMAAMDSTTKARTVSEELATLSNARLGALRVNLSPPPRPWARDKGEVLATLGSLIGGEPGGAAFISPTDSKAKIIQKAAGNASFPILVANLNNRVITGRVAGAVSSLSKLKLIKTDPGYSQAAFNLVTKPFTFVHGLWATLTCAKKTYDMAYDVAADVSRHQDRIALQKLLKEWDPGTGKFIADDGTLYESKEKMAQLRELANKPNAWREDKWYGQKWRTTEGGNIWRTPRQRALDVMTNAKDMTGTLLGAGVPNLMLFNAVAGSATAVAGNAVASVGHGIIAINQTLRAGVQMTAMNNIEGARTIAKHKLASYKLDPSSVKAVATNQLLVSASNRMLQERTYQARLAWFNAFSYGVSSAITGAGIATMGVGVVATSLVSAVLLIASCTSTAVFGVLHGRTIANRRAENAKVYEAQKRIVESCSEETKRLFFKSLDNKESIGLIERFLLDNLRSTNADNAKEAYDFFRACGISSNTIKSMMLQDAPKALATMQAHMYTNRTKFIGKNVKYTMQTAGYLSGITYARRALKTQAPDEEVRAHSRPQSKNFTPLRSETRSETDSEDSGLDDLDDFSSASSETPVAPVTRPAEVMVVSGGKRSYRY